MPDSKLSGCLVGQVVTGSKLIFCGRKHPLVRRGMEVSACFGQRFVLFRRSYGHVVGAEFVALIA